METEIKTADQIITQIAEILDGASPAFIEQIANQVLAYRSPKTHIKAINGGYNHGDFEVQNP